MSASDGSLFRPYRLRLSLTYTLSLTEFVLELMYPFAIGLAINGLLAGRGIVSVALLAGVWLAQVVVGAAYQVIGSRLVARIYRRIAGELVIRQRKTGVSTSEVSARVDMVGEVCDALSDVVPAVLKGLVGVVGSAVMLFTYDLRAGLVALGLLLPIAVVQWRYGVRASDLNERLNDQRERQVNAVAVGTSAGITTHLRAMARWRVRFADAETATWSISDLFSLGAVILVLLIVTRGEHFDAGSIYAVVSYVMALTDSLETAPVLVDEATHFRDVSFRIAEEIDPDTPDTGNATDR